MNRPVMAGPAGSAPRDLRVGWSSTPDGAQVSMATPAGLVDVTLTVGGEHNVRNAMAAAACAVAIGIEPRAIVAGLAAFRPVPGRGVRLRTAAGAVLIDDSYNANPDSVRAAITLLAGEPAPRLLVLGDMGEVGTQGPQFHAEVGDYARERGIERLYTLGEQARGMGGTHFDDIDSLNAAVRDALADAQSVLVKGSRFMKMERVVEAIQGSADAR